MASHQQNLIHFLIATIFAFASTTNAKAQSIQTLPQELVNGSMEEISPNGEPAGWNFPKVLSDAGYRLSIERIAPHSGAAAAILDSTEVQADTRSFGNLMQSIDASPFRGKLIRFRAAVRVDSNEPTGRAQLWLRVDRRGNGAAPAMGAFDNMDDRPIRNASWTEYEIVGRVDDDATSIHVGMLVLGRAKVWFDDAILEIAPDDAAVTGRLLNRTDDPPQPFFVPWLWLAGVGVALLGLSQMGIGVWRNVAFRFVAAYWLLYSLPAPLSSIVPVYGYRWLTIYDNKIVEPVVRWTASDLLGIKYTLIPPNGSGDTTFDYVRLLVCFGLAVVIAAMWSLIDRRKTEYAWANDLLRSYVRYVLAFTLLGYGLAKVGSTYNQFPEPGVDQLVLTYGESSPMTLVWTFMGASRSYTFFAGLGEVAAAVFLVWRRTTILGAAIGLGVMANVVMLNFCYDVPVKQYSAHLSLMAVWLLLGDWRRLANVLLLNRPAEPVVLRPPYASNGWIWAQWALKAYLIAIGIFVPIYGTIASEWKPISDSPLPEIFGTYEVEEINRDGQVVPKLFSDETYWKYVSFTRYRGMAGDFFMIQTLDGNRLSGGLTLSSDGKSLTLSNATASLVPTEMAIADLVDGKLELTGVANGVAIKLRLKKLTRETFKLVNRGFHWINEYPFR